MELDGYLEVEEVVKGKGKPPKAEKEKEKTPRNWVRVSSAKIKIEPDSEPAKAERIKSASSMRAKLRRVSH